MISQADFQTYLETIFRPQSKLPRTTVRRIVIDPGHGGKDPGCKSNTVQEKDVNLAVAMKLAAILAKRGYEVGMTRTKDVYLTLQKRVEVSTAFKPDLFISLHCNSASASASGIEIYTATPQMTPASDTTVVSRKPCTSNQFNTQSTFAAFYVQKKILEATGKTDRGIRHKRYTVIADTAAPSILIEMGFLSNTGDRSFLSNNKSQDVLAQAIATAIDYYKKASAPALTSLKPTAVQTKKPSTGPTRTKPTGQAPAVPRKQPAKVPSGQQQPLRRLQTTNSKRTLR